MQIGFESNTVLTQWRAGQADLLPEGMEFWWHGHKFRHRPAGYTDGLSSPQFTHINPDAEPRGWGFMPAVAHDGGYHNDLEIWIPEEGVWRHFHLEKSDCDVMFKELLDMLADTESKKREAMIFYEAVNFGGAEAYAAGQAASRILP